MAAADLIYVIGSKRAFPVTTYISLALSQQGVRNVLIDNVGSTAFDQIGCVTGRDAVLAVSFSPYNSVTPELTAAATSGRRASCRSPTAPSARWSSSPTPGWRSIESDFAGFRSLAATLASAWGMRASSHGAACRRTRAGGSRDGPGAD